MSETLGGGGHERPRWRPGKCLLATPSSVFEGLCVSVTEHPWSRFSLLNSSMLHERGLFWFHCFCFGWFFLFVFLSIVDLQYCVSCKYTAKWSMYIYSFPDYFPLQVITRYWTEFHMLYSKSLLLIYFKYSSLYNFVFVNRCRGQIPCLGDCKNRGSTHGRSLDFLPL